MGFMSMMRGRIPSPTAAVAPQERKPLGGLIGQAAMPQATQVPQTPSMGTLAGGGPTPGGIMGGMAGGAAPAPGGFGGGVMGKLGGALGVGRPGAAPAPAPTQRSGFLSRFRRR